MADSAALRSRLEAYLVPRASNTSLSALPSVIDLLRSLAVKLQSAIERVQSQAAEARTTLDDLPDPECSSLLGAVSAAEVRKVSALEAQAVTVDNLLDEALELAAEADVLVASDGGSAGAMTTCCERFEKLQGSLSALAWEPVEPTDIRICKVDDASASEKRWYMQAPEPVREVTVALATTVAVAVCGGLLAFDIMGQVCDPRLGEEVAGDAHVSNFLATHVRLELFMLGAEYVLPRDYSSADSSSKTVKRLPFTLTPISQGIRISIPVPVEAVPGVHSICVRSVRVAGRQIELGSLALVPVIRGMCAPLRFRSVLPSPDGYPGTPAISGAGMLFVPHPSDGHVNVFGPNGELVTRLDARALGMAHSTASVAVIDNTSTPKECGDGILLIVDDDTTNARLVACSLRSCLHRFEPPTRLWVTPPESFNMTGGLTTLPAHGIVIVGSWMDDRLYVHRASDGARVGSTSASDPLYAVADPLSSRIYVSVRHCQVACFEWVVGHEEGLLQMVAESLEGIDESSSHTLAYVPPVCARDVAVSSLCGHLVVGNSNNGGRLIVFALHPGAVPVRVHDHVVVGENGADVSIVGLAGDPSGAALAVSDSDSGDIIVLQWPLTGMSL